ncbi:Detected protein of confused Function [Hibiscus syriacus]|uniref:Detected protein of confused Function n=1 Tax=Hibiscus syriacus TaxID=106335 RepID=A0A6A3CQR7_HIBSY|nr:Detected protein of confused Function [Hibiscus syriacus]
MANGTRSSSRKAKDDENNGLKGIQSTGKKLVNLGAATTEASGVRRSPRETLSKKNMTPPSSSGMWKSERLEKQTSNLNSMTPAKRKSERVEKKKGMKNASPLRRSERGKISSSASSGSKRSDKSLNVLNTKRKKEKKNKCVKQLTMQTVEVKKIEQDVEQAEETQKKRMTARSYKALFTKQPKKVDGTDSSNDLNGAASERREDILVDLTERTQERTTVTSTSQFAEEKPKRNNERKLFPTSQKNSCNNMSSNGGDPQLSQNVLVSGETNVAAEITMHKNLQSPQLVNSIVPGGLLDCDISVEMVPKVMPSERKGHDIDMDSVASPKSSSHDIGTCTGDGTSLSSGCKRKDCTETCGLFSKRKRVDCNSTKQEICSSNMKLNQFFGSPDVKDIGKLDAGISTGHIEKPCNHIQQHMPSEALQTGCGMNTCIICILDGKLLCCHGKGCQRRYHLSCLEPPIEKFPLGVWYCPECVWKTIESGIYSVSERIEAIWDSRELETSDDGLQRQKQYFVKYKGLAHVHNRWVPENQVLLEAPSLTAKYNRKKQGAVWKQQWAIPHRLLQKRLLTAPKDCGEHHNKEHDVDKLNCHVEWLVKWHGLSYEHATWELENASFFSCPEGQRLKREYETRKKGQRASKFDKEGAVESLKISHLPASFSSGMDANIDAVSKLCNYWRKGQNAIIFDDQERISNVISSILAFSSEISRPFLIISSAASQYSWDEEFLRLAPSVDVVVYSGSKEIRDSINNLEFYAEGGCIMFQVFITSPEVISEDLNVLDCIVWEVIIVDECQRPRIGSCFEQIKMLTASKRLLIISSQLKGTAAEYLNLLPLLDTQSDSNDSELTNSSDNIATMKERLAKYVAYECKLESSRFLEYWVPTDPVGVLSSIVVSSRKVEFTALYSSIT